MKSMMVPRAGKGKELCDLLRNELGVPAKAVWFEVRFAHDELVTVRCDYHPEEENPDGGLNDHR